MLAALRNHAAALLQAATILRNTPDLFVLPLQMLAGPPSVDVSGLQEEVDGLRATATQAQSTAERCMKRLADMGERLEALELQGPPVTAPAALPSMPSSAAAAAAGGDLEAWQIHWQIWTMFETV